MIQIRSSGTSPSDRAAPSRSVRRARRGLLKTGPAAILVSFALSGCSDESPPPRTEAVESVVLITLDTTRVDRLGCYGAAQSASPRLDRLAAEGVTFDTAFAPVPYTLPTHASLLTGEYPFVHGLRSNGLQRLPDVAATLAERARDAGAATGAFVSAAVLGRAHGLDQGFDVYDDAVERGPGSVPERTGAATVAAALAWLDTVEPERPVFLWIHLYDPHSPYLPAAAGEPFEDDPYSAEIHRADRAIGRVVDRIRGSARDESTWICVTADHGEALGEHGEATHGTFLYQSVMRVPLIWWHARHTRELSSRRSATIASVVDVAPTLLELAGYGDFRCAGRSLAASAHDPSVRLDDAPIYLESYVPYLDFGWSPLEAIVLGDHKWIETPDPELYHWRDDPAEADNLVAAKPDVAAGLQRALQTLRSQRAGELGRELLGSESTQDLTALGYTGGGRDALNSALPAPGPEAGPDAKSRVPILDQLHQLVEGAARRDPRVVIELAEQILPIDDANRAVLRYYGIALARVSRNTEALTTLRKLESLSSLDADALLALGRASLGTGDREQAQEAWTRCLEQRPNDPMALSWLTELALAQNDRPAAIEYVERMLQAAPEAQRPAIERRLQALRRGQ